jgi:hypothetical protein
MLSDARRRPSVTMRSGQLLISERSLAKTSRYLAADTGSEACPSPKLHPPRPVLVSDGIPVTCLHQATMALACQINPVISVAG